MHGAPSKRRPPTAAATVSPERILVPTMEEQLKAAGPSPPRAGLAPASRANRTQSRLTGDSERVRVERRALAVLGKQAMIGDTSSAKEQRRAKRAVAKASMKADVGTTMLQSYSLGAASRGLYERSLVAFQGWCGASLHTLGEGETGGCCVLIWRRCSGK